MKRRHLLAAAGVGLIGSLAGCTSRFNLHCPRPWFTDTLDHEVLTAHPLWTTTSTTEEASTLFTDAEQVEDQSASIERFAAEHDAEVEGFEAQRGWLLETDFDAQSVLSFFLIDAPPATGDSFAIRWVEQIDETLLAVTCLPSTSGDLSLTSYHYFVRVEHRLEPQHGEVRLAHPSGGERTVRTDGTVTDDPPSIIP